MKLGTMLFSDSVGNLLKQKHISHLGVFTPRYVIITIIILFILLSLIIFLQLSRGIIANGN